MSCDEHNSSDGDHAHLVLQLRLLWKARSGGTLSRSRPLEYTADRSRTKDVLSDSNVRGS